MGGEDDGFAFGFDFCLTKVPKVAAGLGVEAGGRWVRRGRELWDR